MYELKEKATALQKELPTLVERDAEVFEPLSKAYGMPRATEEEKAEKARVMAIVLKDACAVPWRSWRNAVRLWILIRNLQQRVPLWPSATPA